MRFHIHHTVELGPESRALILGVAGALHGDLTILINQGTQTMKTLADLTVSITALKTTDEGMEALLVGLTQKIADLKTANTDVTTGAAIDALVTEVDQIRGTAAAAIVANTPSDPAAVPVAPPAPPVDDVVATLPIDQTVPSVAPVGETFTAPIPPVGAGAVQEDPAPMVNGQPAATTGSTSDLLTSLQASHDAAKADSLV
jgi:hypothetical protein